MIDPKSHKQQPITLANPNSSPSEVAIIPEPAPSQDQIRERAYELYETRGCEPGQDEQDWLRAEQQILKPKE